MIRECSKLAQSGYKAIHHWVGKVIHWEFCKKLKFDSTSIWCMHKQKSVLKNATHRTLRNFEIQTDHLIPAGRPDKKKKKNLRTDFVVAACYRMKIQESEKRDKYLNFVWELKKLWNMRVTVIPIVIGTLGTVPRCLERGLDWRSNRDHPNYRIFKIG